MSSFEPDSVEVNREVWTRSNAEYTDASALEAWQRPEITWGVWHRPECEVQALSDDLAGLDVVELGCGTAYISAWLARRGARPVGVDPTPAQLETARRMQRETGIEFPLIEAPAESVPLPDACADLVVSEYGASIWADPERWLFEAARLLRPGGLLVFLRGSTIALVCAPDYGPVDTRLHKSYDEIHRMDWRYDEGGIEFHPPPGDVVRLLREAGFEVEKLIELRAPVDAVDHPYYDFVPVTWARRWPAEEIWVARKRG
jgi:ubiquinone/menaquinone biosynthesis C-methylase UbiE